MGSPSSAPLAADLAGNEIIRVRGIVNGTTNFILTAMAQDGEPYDEVLREAQDQGYAEADPSGDVEGDDAVNKLVILARLAFGRWLVPVEHRPAATDRPGHGPSRDHRRDRPGDGGRGRPRADHQAAGDREPARR